MKIAEYPFFAGGSTARETLHLTREFREALSLCVSKTSPEVSVALPDSGGNNGNPACVIPSRQTEGNGMVTPAAGGVTSWRHCDQCRVYRLYNNYII